MVTTLEAFQAPRMAARADAHGLLCAATAQPGQATCAAAPPHRGAGWSGWPPRSRSTPDPLVAQVLMASTYPLEIVQAGAVRQGRSDAQGRSAREKLKEQDLGRPA